MFNALTIKVVSKRSLNISQHSQIYDTDFIANMRFRKSLNAHVGTQLTFVDIVPSWFLSNISKAALKAASSSGRSLSAIMLFP